MPRKATPSKRFRVWPGIIFPLGLTLLLALAAWQFVTGVTAEQARRDTAHLALSSSARTEAAELARRARDLARTLLDDRLSARAEQEENLRVEIRGLMEAVNQVIAASLERNRAQGASRREVPAFPSGFESVRKYLELSRADEQTDRALKALHACAPELGNILPAGCSLAIVENSALEIFAIGGGAAPEGSLSLAMSREFAWSDGQGAGRRWTILLRLHAPDRHPLPQPEDIAERLTRELGAVALNSASWRGWLIGQSGQPVASFPVPAASGAPASAGEALPFTGAPGEWVETDGRTLVWLEGGSPLAAPAGLAGDAGGQNIVPAVAVSIPLPAPPLDVVDEFLGDTRWVCTLGALALGALGFWIWFFRNSFSARRRAVEAEAEVEAVRVPPRRRQEPLPISGGAEAVAAELRRRLVRDGGARAVSDVEDVIVADIAPGGGMTVSGAKDFSDALRSPPPAPPVSVLLPSGSLFRLQARHRGGKGKQGSRALDRATNPVLKALAARIRPAAPAAPKPAAPQGQTSSRPRGRATERFVRTDRPES